MVFVSEDGVVHAADEYVDYSGDCTIGSPAGSDAWTACEQFGTDNEATLYWTGSLLYQEDLEVTCLACLVCLACQGVRKDSG